MNSFALTLGRAKGTVLLGQALKLTVPVQMEAGEGAAALCFEADVFYGDTRQDASRVAAASEWLPQSQSANVMVSARGVVDEPVVTVYLRAGCESKTTRRYVLLAELGPTVDPLLSKANPLPAPVVLPLIPATESASASKGTATVPRLTNRAKAAVVDAQRVPVAEVRTDPKPPKPEARRAHLKLAPLDFAQERDPTLKLSSELPVDGGEDLQKRARAVALWRSLNATPQEVLSAESRRQALESDLKGLRDITMKNRQVLEVLTRRLSTAESERYSNPVVYGLFAVLALCGLALALMWSRSRRGGRVGVPWWRGDGGGGRSNSVEFGNDDPPTTRYGSLDSPNKADGARTAAIQGRGEQLAPRATHVDIDLPVGDPLDRLLEPVSHNNPKGNRHGAPSKPGPHVSGHMDFAHSMSATLRAVNTKEMLDVRQQAEFFMTLGQHEEAVALLRESVDAGDDANPLVFLELLRVLHSLGRKAEYDQYRSGFNAIFNGHIPLYADFNQSGSGLEAYPEVCRRIVALWPSEEAVSYIENCLVRTHKESGAQDFDLGAFRDLLMLHGVASRIATTSFDSGFMAFSAAKSGPAPVTISSATELDFDLSETRDNGIDFESGDWPPSNAGGQKRTPR